MRPKFMCVVIGLVVMGFGSGIASANLIQNPSFEETPCATPCNLAQGILPSSWLVLSVTPDTYSNDGSYGLDPTFFGNFNPRFVRTWPTLAPTSWSSGMTLTPTHWSWAASSL